MRLISPSCATEQIRAPSRAYIEPNANPRAAAALGSLGLDNEDNQVQVTQMLIELLASGSESAQRRAAERAGPPQKFES